MKKFLLKTTLLVSITGGLLLLLCILTFCVAAPQFRSTYMGAMADKAEQLCNTQGPKIILVGNSNLSFGIDSSLLEEAMQMPVVNMGGNGALGDAFHLNTAKLNVGPGDIVVLSTNTFSTLQVENGLSAWSTIENHFELWPLIEPGSWPQMLVSLPSYIQLAWSRYFSGEDAQPVEGAYARAAFNAHGDVALYREQELTFTPATRYVPEITAEYAAFVNQMNAYLQDRGATLLIAAYPIAYGEYTAPAEVFDAFQAELESMVDCPVISRYTDYFIDYSFFYDEKAHLTTEGAKIRTELLIGDLQRWISGAP